MKITLLALAILATLTGCIQEKSDTKQTRAQEVLLAEGTAQTGMPSITNFTERKQLKQILELRDKPKLATYTYLVAEQTGKLVHMCDSIGFGIPAATQYTNPQRQARAEYSMPQADPNGLFSPASADGTWVLCVDPKNAANVEPTFVEPRVIVSRFQLGN